MYKWNSDSSTYVFQPMGVGDKVCSLSPSGEILRILKELDGIDKEDFLHQSTSRGYKTKSISTSLTFALKVHTLPNADGEKGPAIMIVAIKDLADDVWHVEEVAGLSFTCEAGSKGFLYV